MDCVENLFRLSLGLRVRKQHAVPKLQVVNECAQLRIADALDEQRYPRPGLLGHLAGVAVDGVHEVRLASPLSFDVVANEVETKNEAVQRLLQFNKRFALELGAAVGSPLPSLQPCAYRLDAE